MNSCHNYILYLVCLFLLPNFRSLLSSDHVSLCATSSISSWTWSTLSRPLPTLLAGSCGELTVHTAAAVSSYGTTHLPTTLWQPSCVPPCAAISTRGDCPRKPCAYWNSPNGCTLLRTWIQGQIPANRGLLPSGSTSHSDQTFMPQGMVFKWHFCSCVCERKKWISWEIEYFCSEVMGFVSNYKLEVSEGGAFDKADQKLGGNLLTG